MNEPHTETNKNDDGDNLEKNHDVVRFGGFTNPAHQNHAEQHDDQERGPVEAEVPARRIEFISRKIAETAREVRGRNPARVGMHAEPVQQTDNMRRESDAHGHVTDGIFEYEVPANNPGDEFAHG